jgi:hypothetical protein
VVAVQAQTGGSRRQVAVPRIRPALAIRVEGGTCARVWHFGEITEKATLFA